MADTSTDMDKDKVYRDSLGDYVCSVCKRNHTTKDMALSCWRSHQSDCSEEGKQLSIATNTAEAVARYSKHMAKNDMMSAGKNLMLSMLEDYHMVRESDIQKVGRPGPLTLNFSKAASETMMAMLKSVYGERSMGVNVNIDGSKPDDITALKDFIRGNNSIDMDKAESWEEGDPVPYSKKFTEGVKRDARRSE
jgi:ribosomal protein L37AE/L43A